jgi:hypothetical protein
VQGISSLAGEQMVVTTGILLQMSFIVLSNRNKLVKSMLHGTGLFVMLELRAPLIYYGYRLRTTGA